MVKANMKHSKGVCENDSMSSVEICSSNEFLELFKSKKHARIFIHMLKSLVHRNHDIHNSLCESNALINTRKRIDVCVTNLIFLKERFAHRWMK